MHKSGYITIIGNPNVGKSTFLNNVIGEKISSTSNKAQTTRHRLLGILNSDNYQMIFSDTPGVIESNYELHKAMMSYVKNSLSDSILLIGAGISTLPSKRCLSLNEVEISNILSKSSI